MIIIIDSNDDGVHTVHVTERRLEMQTATTLRSENTSEAQSRTRVATLEGLAAELRNFSDESDREAFSDLFSRAQTTLELEDSDLARTLKVSRPTVGRWARAESAPHPIGRRSVLDSMAALAHGKLKIARRRPDR